MLLPCALYSAFSELGQVAVWATLPATSILAFFLFGVDELAMQLEEPFSILPMSYYCSDILKSMNVLLSGLEEQDTSGDR
jgi:ion channel-forming bestrophin family protein